jgi:hypothetical protein
MLFVPGVIVLKDMWSWDGDKGHFDDAKNI